MYERFSGNREAHMKLKSRLKKYVGKRVHLLMKSGHTFQCLLEKVCLDGEIQGKEFHSLHKRFTNVSHVESLIEAE